MIPKIDVKREHFANSNELFENYLALKKKYPDRYNIEGQRGWYGDFWDIDQDREGERIFQEGTERYNEEIAKVSETIWGDIPALRKEWHTQFIGAFPNVPAFLAGEPETMWRLEERESVNTPLRIWLGTGTSAGTGERRIIKKYSALTAFAQALSEVRPVLLTPYDIFGVPGSFYRAGPQRDYICSWDISVSPMIVSHVASQLIEPRVIRGVLFHHGAMALPGWTTHWGYGFQDEKYMREVLGCAEDDLWLGSTYLLDELLEDPIAWVRKHIAKYTSKDGDQDGGTFR